MAHCGIFDDGLPRGVEKEELEQTQILIAKTQDLKLTSSYESVDLKSNKFFHKLIVNTHSFKILKNTITITDVKQECINFLHKHNLLNSDVVIIYPKNNFWMIAGEHDDLLLTHKKRYTSIYRKISILFKVNYKISR